MPTIDFTTGDDRYVLNSVGEFTLNFLAGNDHLTVTGGDASIANMGDGDDFVRVDAGMLTAYGEAGADRFDLYAAATAYGGIGSDLINIRGGGSQIAYGDEDNDRFNFYAGALGVQLFGGAGDDRFYGYYHSISGEIHGGNGDDYFVLFREIGANQILIYGGVGNDIYRADALNAATFIENPDEGRDSVQVARGATFTLPDNIENISISGFSGSTSAAAVINGNNLDNGINGHANVETIYGYDGVDRIYGKGGNDTLYGGTGNDTLDGGSGDDQMFGEDGDDILNGRDGIDLMVGGTGSDTYYVDNAADQIIELADEGIELVRTSADFILPDNVENAVVSGGGNVAITGNALANSLTGLGGNNVLNGLGGDDIINGGAGNDTIDGGDGADRIIGGLGFDTLTGGAGYDLFVFTSVADSLASNPDVILDFDTVAEAGGDTLNLSAIDADVTTAGDQAFTITTDPFNGTPGQMRFTVTIAPDGGRNWTFFGDVDGDMQADFAITVHTAGQYIYFDDFIL